MTARVSLALLERLENQPFLLGPHPLERAHASLESGLLQIVQRPDAKLSVEHRDGLRPNPLQIEQIDDRGWKFSGQFAAVLAVAGERDLLNTGGEVFADT